MKLKSKWERKGAVAHQMKISELNQRRNMVKERILKLRREINELVEKAASADDLERKILSLEYEEKKRSMTTEMEHFNDLSKLISQMNGIAITYERQKIFNQWISDVESLNASEIRMENNRMEARRMLMQEESDALDDVLQTCEYTDLTMEENREFMGLVEAQKRRNCLEETNKQLEKERVQYA